MEVGYYLNMVFVLRMGVRQKVDFMDVSCSFLII